MRPDRSLVSHAVTPSKRQPKPRWKRRKDARPGEIVAAALEVFGERGFAATKLAMSPLMHAVVAKRAFASCMPEGFDVKKYLDTHIDLYLHGIAKQ